MLEVNHIYQGDSTQRLKQLDANSVNLVATSPPYFAYKDYGSDAGNIENFDSYAKYIEYFEDWFKELYRVVDEDGRVCIVVDDRHTSLKVEGENRNLGTHARMILLAEKAGFVYKDLIIWSKVRVGHASGGSGNMLGSFPYPPNIPLVNWFEYILVFRKDGVSRVSRVTEEQKAKSVLTFGKEFKKWAAKSIWDIPAEREDKGHPCPFPAEIPRRLITLFSFFGDVVLDPFVGSGTTAEQSLLLGRRFIGFDLNPVFCSMSVKELKAGKEQRLIC